VAHPDGTLDIEVGDRRTVDGALTLEAAADGVSATAHMPSSAVVASILGSLVPPSWPAAALQAHAVVLRSALERATAQGDPVPADWPWPYRGVRRLGDAWQVDAMLVPTSAAAAADATRGLVLRRGDRPIAARLTHSNGGVTAAARWGTPSAVPDPWDWSAIVNQRRAWTATVDVRALQAAAPAIGRLRSVILERDGVGPWGGRVTALQLVGRDGTEVLRGDAITTTLGVPSGLLSLRDPALGGWVPPLSDPLTWGAAFGQSGVLWSWGYHTGQDFPAGTSTRVLAMGAGTVVEVGTSGAYGISVLLEHPDGTRSRYAHLNQAVVRVGSTVEAGQVLGNVGSTGNSTGPHLHLEILVNGLPADPAPLLRGAPADRPAAEIIDPVLAARPLLASGSTAPDVRRLQRALRLDVSGYFGSTTSTRLRTFQDARALPTTGTTTVRTWRALEQRLAGDRRRDAARATRSAS
jgi:murein DD-endopeptidase MepM/ murein hydrolase activator NlpD